MRNARWLFVSLLSLALVPATILAQQIMRVSRIVMAGQIISSPAAAYPDDAKVAGIEGTVLLDATISASGSVEQVQVLSGPDQLREAAKDAVSKWTYHPYLLDGVATQVKTTVRVEFILSGTDHAASTRNASADEKEIQTTSVQPGSPSQSVAGTVRMSSGVVGANKLSGARPSYPSNARDAGVSGAVILYAVISEIGNIETLSVISGPEMLRKPAMDAVYTWKYKPFLKSGQPVKVETTITVNYAFLPH